MVELANMVLLLWLLPDFVFVRSRFRVCCCSCAGLSEGSARPKLCSSTDIQNLLEYLWRCPSIDPSAAFVTLLGQSMALGESHVILGLLPPFQAQVSAVSDLPSVVLLNCANSTHMFRAERPVLFCSWSSRLQTHDSGKSNEGSRRPSPTYA